jgi:hypothetical protein
VADGERSGIHLRLEGDLAAMAVSVDLHTFYPVIVPQGDAPGRSTSAPRAMRIIMSLRPVSARRWIQGEGAYAPRVFLNNVSPVSGGFLAARRHEGYAGADLPMVLASTWRPRARTEHPWIHRDGARP